jgi:hypothetical protein
LSTPIGENSMCRGIFTGSTGASVSLTKISPSQAAAKRFIERSNPASSGSEKHFRFGSKIRSAEAVN